jgi:hypothetical protein
MAISFCGPIKYYLWFYYFCIDIVKCFAYGLPFRFNELPLDPGYMVPYVGPPVTVVELAYYPEMAPLLLFLFWKNEFYKIYYYAALVADSDAIYLISFPFYVGCYNLSASF